MINKVILPLAASILLLSCAASKNRSAKNNVTQKAIAKTDTARKDTGRAIVRKYNDVITPGAITDDGLIKVHRVESKYYFEIEDSLLDKDILIVNRISKAAEGFRPMQGMAGYAGDYIGENVVRFEKGPDNKMFIRRLFYMEMSKDSSENGMYRSYRNSNLFPIIASFDIKAYGKDSASSVIELTDYLKIDNDVFFFNPIMKKQFGLGGLQADKSYISSIKSFPLNTEIKTVKTYQMNDYLLTYELNSSIVLLPSVPMSSRVFDKRVGYFARSFNDYDYPQAAKETAVVVRWKLEPKPADIEKYKRGELVEPKKPIVYYIDPATPKKWVPYLIQGVNAWQKAFEKAGFKNAIYALEVPANDSTWSMEDARHNFIIYKASFVQNASGPQVSDPRTGEILESHINWYHNVQKLLHDWYFIQASPNDPRARTMEFNDSLMGQLIQFVCTHEIGHTLGLQHNFIASSFVPVDSLRSRSYVAKNGHTPSIMDYTRFNYVAQPEDRIDVKDLIPRIGIYDDWAIEWGYRWFPEFKSAEEERDYMNQWVVQQLNKDQRLIFAQERSRDYRGQSEDLGDDAVKAGSYGIKNLQRVMSHLKEWTSRKNGDYSDMTDMLNQIISQFSRYLYHAAQYVGGVSFTPKTIDQKGQPLSFAPAEKQRAAIKFLNEQLFDTPYWLCNKELTAYTGKNLVVMMHNLQILMLHNLLSGEVNNGLLSNDSYNFNDVLNDLEVGIWKELDHHRVIDMYRRNLQKIYTQQLIDYIRRNAPGDFGRMDAYTAAVTHLEILQKKIGKAMKEYKDEDSRLHLKDLYDRYTAAIKFKKEYAGESPNTISVNVKTGLSGWEELQAKDTFLTNTIKQTTEATPVSRKRSCWQLLEW